MKFKLKEINKIHKIDVGNFIITTEGDLLWLIDDEWNYGNYHLLNMKTGSIVSSGESVNECLIGYENDIDRITSENNFILVEEDN